MSLDLEFKYILEELRVYNRNLIKDNKDRRNDSKVLEKQLRKLDRLKLGFVDSKKKFNSQVREPGLIAKVKLFVSEIDKYFEHIYKTLNDRLKEAESIQSEAEIDLNLSDSEVKIKMSEKFDLRTAAGLIPVMNGSESITKQIIDAIQLYDSLLDNDGKKLLTNYVLKTRLSESAKIRLKQSYTSNELLIDDLKNYFIAKKSVSALSLKLSNAKQQSKSIDEFGNSLEELLVGLTLTQADGNEQHINILRPVNEKLAINSFANGLNNRDLRTIIKARNYSTLNDAIRGAKDEELSLGDSRPLFQMRTYNSNSYFRGSNNRGYFRQERGAYRNFGNGNGNNGYNNYNGNFNRNRGQSNNRKNPNFSKSSNFVNRTNSNFNNNRRGNHFGNRNRGYFMQNSGSRTENLDTNLQTEQSTFFRGQRD